MNQFEPGNNILIRVICQCLTSGEFITCETYLSHMTVVAWWTQLTYEKSVFPVSLCSLGQMSWTDNTVLHIQSEKKPLVNCIYKRHHEDILNDFCLIKCYLWYNVIFWQQHTYYSHNFIIQEEQVVLIEWSSSVQPTSLLHTFAEIYQTTNSVLSPQLQQERLIMTDIM